MASKKFYADLDLQTGVRISGDGVDTTSGGTASSDKVITSGAVKAGLDGKADLAGSSSQDFSTNNLTVNGNLTISGEINQTTVNNLNVDDRNITLNNGGTLGQDSAGLIVDGSGTTTDAEFYYDGDNGGWYFKNADSTAVQLGDVGSHTHAAGDITSGTFADALVAASNVTQHQGSLSIGWSQLTSVPATFAPSAHTHAAGDITTGSFADGRIQASNVTQHQAALSIAWSQLTSIPLDFNPTAHTHAAGDITSGTFDNGRIAETNVTQHQAALSIGWSQLTSVPTYDNYSSWTISDGTNSEGVGSGNTVEFVGGGGSTVSYDTTSNRLSISTPTTWAASDITTGTFADGRIAASNVTQHQGSLSIGWGQLTSVPSTFTPATHTHAAGDITTGSFADGRIQASNVTQHQAALSIGWSQLTSVPSDFHADHVKGSISSATSLTVDVSSLTNGGTLGGIIAQVFDGSGNLIDCGIQHDSANTDVIFTFDSAFTGKYMIIG